MNNNRNEFDSVLRLKDALDYCRYLVIVINDKDIDDIVKPEKDNNQNNNNNKNDPIKHLGLIWDGGYYDDPTIAPVEFNAIWQLQHIEKLVFDEFPFDSMIGAETETASNNSSTNSSNNDNNETTTTTTPMTISIGNLSKTLKQLTFRSCYRENFRIPSDIGFLANLTELEIRSCENLEMLPSEIGNLSSLQCLSIADMSVLQCIPSEIGNLKKTLKKLTIMNCKSLVEIPEEVNNELSENLTSLIIYNNGQLHPTFSFNLQIGRFKNLQELKIGLGIFSTEEDKGVNMSWQQQQATPIPSLETLGLYGFNEGVLRALVQQDAATTTTTITETATTISNPSPLPSSSFLLSLVTRNLKILELLEFKGKIPKTRSNQDIIHKILQEFPRLFISTFSTRFMQFKSLQDEESLGLFTKESFYLMFFNRCGRILLCNDFQNDRRPFPLSMWPMVLEQVSGRIGRLGDKESEQVLEASVIFSFLKEISGWMGRPKENVSLDNDDDDDCDNDNIEDDDNNNDNDNGCAVTTALTTAAATTTTTETRRSLKRPFPS